MSEKQIDLAALEMFRVMQKARGLTKSAADEQWRALGAPGRKEWRDMATAAHRVITGAAAPAAKKPAKPAAPPAAPAKPKPGRFNW